VAGQELAVENADAVESRRLDVLDEPHEPWHRLGSGHAHVDTDRLDGRAPSLPGGQPPAVCIGDPPTARGLPRVFFRMNESHDLPRVGTRGRPQARGRRAARAWPWPAGD